MSLTASPATKPLTPRTSHTPLLPFGSLWKHRDLIRQFAWRYIEQRHRGSLLGLVWMVLTPLLMLGLYTFVFGYVFKGTFGTHPNETPLDYALGILVGLVAFHFVAEVLSTSSGLVVANPNFVKKVVFPLEILPAAAVLSTAVTAGVSVALALIGIVFLGPGLSWWALQAFLILPPLVLMAMGAGWFLAALGVFIRDTSAIMPFLVQILLYTSAIFYPLARVPATLWPILRLNPLLHAVEALRKALLWQQAVDLRTILMLWTVGLVAAVLGHWIFVKAKPAFADVI